MDINSLRALATVLVAVAFVGVCWWAFSPKRKKRFEEDAQLPFADEEQSQKSAEAASQKHHQPTTDKVRQNNTTRAQQKKGQDKS
ncbi:MAG: cbb3-type cytochrome c oxidase subunit 3 [Gammaproteobacteria bacterium]|nr:cbb3-type cytochrome c oxidase subunit 3 [Gammaproteobacteria bacterium]